MTDELKRLKSQFDMNSDDEVSQEEIDSVIKMREFENKDEKADTQKKMAWFALFGMLLYPLIVVIVSYFGMDNAAKVLGDMAAVYFGSVALIVAAFFGAEAYKDKR